MPIANRRPVYSLIPRLFARCAASILRNEALGLAVSTAGCASVARGMVDAAPAGPAPGQAVYDTDVRLDLAGGSLEGRSRIRFVAGDSTARRVALLLNRALQVQSVTGPAVRGFRVEPSELTADWNAIRIDLNEGVAPSSQVELQIAWAGRPEVPSDSSNRITPEYVELNLDSQWHPVFAGLDHTMTGVVRVALPAGWRVAASGLATFSGGAHVIRNTVPQVDVAFLAAPAFQSTRSPRFTVLHRGAEPAAVAAILSAAESCAQYLNQRFGARDSLPPGTVVLAGRGGPGYARKNYIVLSEVSPADSVAVHSYLCHELAHYWTRSVGSYSPHHWMTETFPEYTSARFLRERFGEAAFQAQVTRWEQASRAHGPVWTPESTRRPSFFVMYRRGPWLLSRLEERIGTERFDRFLQAYMTEHLRTTPELLQRLESIAGAEAARWFRDELARAPAPPS
jgi:hypothetical protein